MLIATACFAPQVASADNAPTFRDCSFVGGLDPDFVQLSGVSADSQGNLIVSPAQSHVTIKASESADPGDSSGHVTLAVTVSAPSVAPKMLSGAGTGKVVLSVPLSGAPAGSTYTISWAATFDNGNHACPSSMTPKNTAPTPFVLHVVANAPLPVLPTVTHVRESHHVWRERKGTTFSFRLNEPATVTLTFTQRLHGHKVTRGMLSVSGHTGKNRIHFKGRISASKKLRPGRYRLVLTATNAAGQSPTSPSISFTIVK